MLRRGSTFYVRNTNSSRPADTVFAYGKATDTVLVGDWDGNGTDTVLVGHWSGGLTGDTLGVRRGNVYYLRYSLTPGTPDQTVSYGRTTDTAFVGDWNGDGVSTLGLRPPRLSYSGTRTYRVGVDIPAGTYRSSGGGSCYWARLSGFGGTADDVIAYDIPSGPPIVRIKSTDKGFDTDGCGTWTP